jgi:CHAD domain-containing protein
MKLAAKISPDYEEENIHKVRTTIKKLRAIGDWADVPVKSFFKKDYRILGNVRDTQLLLSKIKNGDYVVTPAFTEWLENELGRYKAEWQKKYHYKRLKKQLTDLEEKLNEAVHRNKHSLKFEKQKDQTLSSFVHERPISDEKIHSGRKTIKEIGFLNKWEKNSSDEQMKKLSDETGNYMDRINAIKLLDQYLSEETDESNKNKAELILSDWKADKEQEKINLLKRIDSLPA